FQPAAARQHEIEQHQVEPFRIRPVEAVLAGCRDDDLVMFTLQRRRQHLRELPLVLDNQHTHHAACYRPALTPTLTFVSGTSACVGDRNGKATSPGHEAVLMRPASSSP